jgi:hypothetical protein
MKTCGGMEVELHAFLTSTLYKVSKQLLVAAALLPGINPQYWTEGWVCPRAGPQAVGIRKISYACRRRSRVPVSSRQVSFSPDTKVC